MFLRLGAEFVTFTNKHSRTQNKRKSFNSSKIFVHFECLLRGRYIIVSLFWRMFRSKTNSGLGLGRQWKGYSCAFACVCSWLYKSIVRRCSLHIERDPAPSYLASVDNGGLLLCNQAPDGLGDRYRFLAFVGEMKAGLGRPRCTLHGKSKTAIPPHSKTHSSLVTLSLRCLYC